MATVLAPIAVSATADPLANGSRPADTWITPAHVIALARDFLGGIDLDPASNHAANLEIGAARYFTEADDGLNQEWSAVLGDPSRLWCNPPYSKIGNVSQAGMFLDKLIREHAAGRVKEGLFLANVCTDTEWFQTMWTIPLVFVRGRLKFHRAGHKGSSPKYPNVIGYVGDRSLEFGVAFRHLGTVILPPWTASLRYFAHAVLGPCTPPGAP